MFVDKASGAWDGVRIALEHTSWILSCTLLSKLDIKKCVPSHPPTPLHFLWDMKEV